MRLRARLIGLAAAVAATAVPLVTTADDTDSFIASICSAEHRTFLGDGPRKIVLIDGVGNDGFDIRTAKPEAQVWFNYGVQLYHAFYHEDAKLAFAKAAEIDPTCAMCTWGQAWANGPTVNFDVEPKDAAEALVFAKKAVELAADGPAKEKALIAAMRLRYEKPGKEGGDERAFVKAMTALVETYPDDNEIADITAESQLMVGRMGDKLGFEKSRELLETVLKRSPDNVAAIHYYIHATELVGQPELAVPYANKLAGLAPKASHLVHMAAHTFFRVGRYYDAAGVNAKALGVDGAHSVQVSAKGELGAIGYYGHNLGFGMAGAMMAGDGPLALKFADHVAVAYPGGKGDNYNGGGQRQRAMAAMGRYAPERALALPDPGKDAGLRRVFWHYARGEAFASKGDAASVRAEADGISGSSWQTKISRGVLQGRAAMLDNDPERAIKLFEAAAKIQDKQLAGAMDPPPWWYPVRRSVAAAQLKSGHYDKAAEAAEASLKVWPHDALALSVLARAEVGLGKLAEARVHMDESRKLWRGPSVDKVALEMI